MKDAFSDLEYGGNGAIRAHDLGTALRAIGQTPTEADIQELLQDAVLDGQFHWSPMVTVHVTNQPITHSLNQ